MTAPQLTIPPPMDDDHEDVAWALRAASAQWRRDARADAISWVRRAAETAQEVGAMHRAAELANLADHLSGAQLVPRPPPPPTAPPPRLVGPASAMPPPPPFPAPPVPAGARPALSHLEAPLQPPVAERPLDEIDELIEDATEITADEIDELIEDDLVFEEDDETTEPSAPLLEGYPEPSIQEVVTPTEKMAPTFASIMSRGSAPELVVDEVDLDDLDLDIPDDDGFSDSEAPTNITSAPEVAGVPREPAPVSADSLDFAEELTPALLDAPVELPPVSESLVDSEPTMLDSLSARSLQEQTFEELELSSVRPPDATTSHAPSVPPQEPFPLAPSAQMPVARELDLEPESIEPEPESQPLEVELESVAPDVELVELEPESVGPESVGAEGELVEPESVGPESIGSEAELVGPESIGSEAELVEPDPEPAPEPEPVVQEPELSDPIVGGVSLFDVNGLQDLPEDAQLELARRAQLVELAAGEEISSFGVALVTQGTIEIMSAVADASCAQAQRGEVVFTRGSLKDGVALRVGAAVAGTKVAIWSDEQLAAATEACPWVADELALVADRYQAFAGAVMGPLGDSLDWMFRSMVLDKCTVRRVEASEVLLEQGKPVDGMYIVGVGRVELVDGDGKVQRELGPGDFVFPETILAAGAARMTVRAGQDGALMLYATRMDSHELLATCPPFIELLAG